MIRKVSFRNFKAYRSLDVELEPFTVLVGPNASGKTTLLEGLELISRLGAKLVTKAANQSGALDLSPFQSYGVDALPELSISGQWSGTDGELRIAGQGVKLRPPQDPTMFEAKSESQQFKFSGTWGGKMFPPSSPGLSSFWSYRPALDVFSAALSSTAILRFELRRLAEASYSDEAVPEIQNDGSGLASVLAHLKLSQDDVFEGIEQALKQIVPSVRRIRIERAPVDQTAVRTIALDEQRHQVPEKRTLWGNRIVLDMRGAKSVSASAVGEGTLMALGLLTVLTGPGKPRLVLLEDIEMALHPAAQAKLIETLRAIQKRDPELQIVATSHSPFILNYLDPKEVRMTFLAENGFARCEKLTAHPEFEKWKDLMSPGEFWSTVGESWIEKVGEASASE